MTLVLPFRELPEADGTFHHRLPVRGRTAIDRADGGGHVRDINPAYIEFVQTERSSWRGFGWVLGAGGGLMCLLMMTPLAWGVAHSARIDPALAYGIAAFGMLLPVLGGLLGYLAARLPLAPPVILSRRARRFYHWQGRKAGWVSVGYDTAVPIVNMSVVVTQAGGGTRFRLHVAELEPGSRRILAQIPVSEVARSAEGPGELWEFLRQYMDRAPGKVPPVPYRPPPGDRASLHARIDRDLLKGLVDEQHRLAPGWFNAFYFGYSAMMEYWYLRAMAWIERTAPRPPFPEELVEAMVWSGANPYQVTPPSPIEQAAMEGRLPHLERRWRIAKVLSTLLYGGILVGMTVIGWNL